MEKSQKLDKNTDIAPLAHPGHIHVETEKLVDTRPLFTHTVNYPHPPQELVQHGVRRQAIGPR
jgi:hypothetical protein